MIKTFNKNEEFTGIDSLLEDIEYISSKTIFNIESGEMFVSYIDTNSNISGIEKFKLSNDDRLVFYYIPNKRCFVIKNKSSIFNSNSVDYSKLIRTGISFSVENFNNSDNNIQIFERIKVAAQVLIKKIVASEFSDSDIETIRILLFETNYDEYGLVENSFSKTKIFFNKEDYQLFLDKVISYD